MSNNSNNDYSEDSCPLLYTLKEVSAALKVSPKTVYYWVSRNEIPFIRIGRHLRFDARKVLKFFEEKTVEKAQTTPWLVQSLPLRSQAVLSSLTTRKAGLAAQNKE